MHNVTGVSHGYNNRGSARSNLCNKYIQAAALELDDSAMQQWRRMKPCRTESMVSEEFPGGMICDMRAFSDVEIVVREAALEALVSR